MNNFKHHPIVVHLQNICRAPFPSFPPFSLPKTQSLPFADQTFSLPIPTTRLPSGPPLPSKQPFYSQDSSSDDNSLYENVDDQTIQHVFPTPPWENAQPRSTTSHW